MTWRAESSLWNVLLFKLNIFLISHRSSFICPILEIKVKLFSVKHLSWADARWLQHKQAFVVSRSLWGYKQPHDFNLTKSHVILSKLWELIELTTCDINDWMSEQASVRGTVWEEKNPWRYLKMFGHLIPLVSPGFQWCCSGYDPNNKVSEANTIFLLPRLDVGSLSS